MESSKRILDHLEICWVCSKEIKIGDEALVKNRGTAEIFFCSEKCLKNNKYPLSRNTEDLSSDSSSASSISFYYLRNYTSNKSTIIP